MKHPLKAAVEGHDLVALALLLTEDVKLFNPVTWEPVQGRDTVVAKFGGALDGFDNFEYIHELAGDVSYARV